MKQKPLLLSSLMLLIFLSCSPCVPVLAWNSTEHMALAEEYASKANLTDIERSLMLKTATLADHPPYAGGMLHGMGNYEKGLEFLYTAALNCKNNINDPIASAYDSSCNDKKYKDLYEKVLLLLEDDVLPDVEERCNCAKAAKILGFACHMAGDTYAHRTIIPEKDLEQNIQTAWEAWCKKVCEKNRFTKEDLPSFSDVFGNELKSGGLYMTAVQNQSAQFKDIKNWNANWPDKKAYFKYMCLAFEDNPDFFPERYTKGAHAITKIMLTSYGKNLPYDNEAFFMTDCPLPLYPATSQS